MSLGLYLNKVEKKKKTAPWKANAAESDELVKEDRGNIWIPGRVTALTGQKRWKFVLRILKAICPLEKVISWLLWW